MQEESLYTNDPSALASVTPPAFVRVHDSREHEEHLQIFSDIDISSSPAFEAALADLFASDKKYVVDLTECPYMDSTGLACLIRARKTWGGQLEIRAAAGSGPARILEVTGLDRALAVVLEPRTLRVV
jgi:anti-anti-sigma factor